MGLWILLLCSIFATFAASQTTTDCKSLHIIVGRASGEKQNVARGEGRIWRVADDICNQTTNCDSYGIVYPATLYNYHNSVLAGVAAMIAAINDYYASCPQTPLVLLGYSQGAQVIGDTLCGFGEAGWNPTAPFTAPASNNIVAIIQMGDPTHMQNLPWNVGNATKNGVLPRSNTAACDPFGSRIQSYCDWNDQYCSSGNVSQVHQVYVPEYGPQAVEFVMSKYDAYTSTMSSTSSRSATSSVVTSTAASTASGITTSLPATTTTSNSANTTPSLTAAATPTSAATIPQTANGWIWGCIVAAFSLLV